MGSQADAVLREAADTGLWAVSLDTDAKFWIVICAEHPGSSRHCGYCEDAIALRGAARRGRLGVGIHCENAVTSRIVGKCVACVRVIGVGSYATAFVRPTAETGLWAVSLDTDTRFWIVICAEHTSGAGADRQPEYASPAGTTSCGSVMRSLLPKTPTLPLDVVEANPPSSVLDVPKCPGMAIFLLGMMHGPGVKQFRVRT
jgi:hypothetical protein